MIIHNKSYSIEVRKKERKKDYPTLVLELFSVVKMRKENDILFCRKTYEPK